MTDYGAEAAPRDAGSMAGFMKARPASRERHSLEKVASAALKAAARSWFVVVVVGQLVFAFSTASFYGLTALRGDYHRWSRFMTQVPGDTIGNWAIAVHLLSAVLVMLAGAVQLVPGVRGRFPVFHRWNGRLYMLAAVALGVGGVYMMWIRGTAGDVPQHLGQTLDAVLIWLCAAVALRHALARNFAAHRRWALRLFLVICASLFIRSAVFLTLIFFNGPVGFDPVTLRGPFLTVVSFAQTLVPLAVLQLYLRAQERPGALLRMATAGIIFVLTFAVGVGLFAVSAAIWVPHVKTAVDHRRSVVSPLSATIAARGVDQAAQQYHQLKAAGAAAYNFDEPELNSLGYRLLHEKRRKEAIRIFQLNVEAYPRSSNVHDSLGEAYLEDGDRARAIVSYRRAVELDPKNRSAAATLKRLESPP
jgi:tetratricopeptide (TPR) repeat protein